MNKILDKHLVYMKIGPFCGFSLEEILQIKKGEESKIGHFYLGYGGVLCQPGKVLRFLQVVRKESKDDINLFFSTTPSNFSSPIKKSELFSIDGANWNKLPSDVLLVGSKFAFVAKDFEGCELALDLSQYKSMLGKRVGKTLDKYIGYRVDKTCAVRVENNLAEEKIINISYKCRLVYPYCVLVR